MKVNHWLKGVTSLCAKCLYNCTKFMEMHGSALALIAFGAGIKVVERRISLGRECDFLVATYSRPHETAHSR